MSVKSRDPLHQIAEQVADCLAASGYAFVEDDKIEGLAALLGSFLVVADVPINPPTHRQSVSRDPPRLFDGQPPAQPGPFDPTA